MAKTNPVLARMRKLCLAFPDTTEEPKWGSPHFCVTGKIFAGCGAGEDGPTIGFKMEKPLQEATVAKFDHFHVARYVGRHGWVQVDAEAVTDWDEIAWMVEQSYRLIAPKRSIKKLDA